MVLYMHCCTRSAFCISFNNKQTDLSFVTITYLKCTAMCQVKHIFKTNTNNLNDNFEMYYF